MAFDWPTSPNTGDTVTGPYGEVYTWNGVSWTLTAGGGGGGNGGGGPYLPLAGGTITGDLAVNGTVTTPTLEIQPGFDITLNGIVEVINWAPNYWDWFNPSNNVRGYTANNTAVFQISNSGDIEANSYAGVLFQVTGSQNFSIYMQGSNIPTIWWGVGYWDGFNYDTLLRTWMGPGNFTQMSLDQSGNLTAAGQIIATGGVSVPGAAPAGWINADGNIWAGGTISATGWMYAERLAGGNMGGGGTLNSGNGGNEIAFGWNSSNLQFNVDDVLGWVSLQDASSDSRIKTNIATATEDALATLQGVELFEFDMPNRVNPEEASRHFDMGFIAQQLREVMPDAVVESPADKQFSDPGQLSLNLLSILARCVGAIKQLSAKVAALETE